MSQQTRRIVSGDDSDIHDEPHIAGSRITVRFVCGRVEEGGLDPRTVAERHDLDISDIYEALAYYHRNPAEMRTVEQRHHEAAAEAAERSSLSPPEE